MSNFKFVAKHVTHLAKLGYLSSKAFNKDLFGQI